MNWFFLFKYFDFEYAHFSRAYFVTSLKTARNFEFSEYI
ncbi:hypothetical protein UF72_0831 [Staphylococcus equorum subsp. equorum]|nr:hypothetical protein UF72_0831 [Staphylococcus equorum subsp. equorum]